MFAFIIYLLQIWQPHSENDVYKRVQILGAAWQVFYYNARQSSLEKAYHWYKGIGLGCLFGPQSSPSDDLCILWLVEVWVF